MGFQRYQIVLSGLLTVIALVPTATAWRFEPIQPAESLSHDPAAMASISEAEARFAYRGTWYRLDRSGGLPIAAYRFEDERGTRAFVLPANQPNMLDRYTLAVDERQHLIFDWDDADLREITLGGVMEGANPGPTSVYLSAGDVLLVRVPAAGDTGYLAAFDPATGERKWQVADDGAFSAPLVKLDEGRALLLHEWATTLSIADATGITRTVETIDPPVGASFDPDRGLIAVITSTGSGGNGSVRLFSEDLLPAGVPVDVPGPQLVRFFAGGSRLVVFSTDTATVFEVGPGGLRELRSDAVEGPLRDYEPHADLRPSPDDVVLFRSFSEAVVWDAVNGRVLRRADLGFGSGALGSDGRTVARVSNDSLEVIDLLGLEPPRPPASIVGCERLSSAPASDTFANGVVDIEGDVASLALTNGAPILWIDRSADWSDESSWVRPRSGDLRATPIVVDDGRAITNRNVNRGISVASALPIEFVSAGWSDDASTLAARCHVSWHDLPPKDVPLPAILAVAALATVGRRR